MTRRLWGVRRALFIRGIVPVAVKTHPDECAFKITKRLPNYTLAVSAAYSCIFPLLAEPNMSSSLSSSLLFSSWLTGWLTDCLSPSSVPHSGPGHRPDQRLCHVQTLPAARTARRAHPLLRLGPVQQRRLLAAALTPLHVRAAEPLAAEDVAVRPWPEEEHKHLVDLRGRNFFLFFCLFLYHLAGNLSRPPLGAESLMNGGATGEHRWICSFCHRGHNRVEISYWILFYPNTGEDEPKTLCTSTHLNLARGAVPVWRVMEYLPSFLFIYIKKEKRLSEIWISDAQTGNTTQLFLFHHLSYSEIFVCSVHSF